MIWNQLAAQVAIVVVGGLLITLYKARLDKLSLVAQRRHALHIARADHLKSLIAKLVEIRDLGGCIFSLNRMKNSSASDARSSALNELPHVSAPYNLALRAAVIEAEQYGLLPDDPRIGDLHLIEYVNVVLNFGLDSSLGGEVWEPFASARMNISALIEDLRALAAYEETVGENELIPKRKRVGLPETRLIFLPEFAYLLPRRQLTSAHVDTWPLEDRQLCAAQQAEANRKRAQLPATPVG